MIKVDYGHRIMDNATCYVAIATATLTATL